MRYIFRRIDIVESLGIITSGIKSLLVFFYKYSHGNDDLIYLLVIKYVLIFCIKKIIFKKNSF